MLSDLREWSAWYSGDPTKLASVYGTLAETTASQKVYGSPTAGTRMRFWGRRGESVPQSRQRLHVPVASDIASTSADLLFGEEPSLRIPEAMGANAPADAKQAQDRLGEIADNIGLTNLLLEGAEVSAALGGVYLRPGWDQEVADHPLLDVIHADAALPSFRGRSLAAVTFHRVVMVDGNNIWRHLEVHEPGWIYHGLYIGTPDSLGTRVPLQRHTDTETLPQEVRLPESLSQGLIVRYVPNVLPNRKYRDRPIGRADFAGQEGLMDSLDEAYTSWMRDIRLGQARIIVSEEALDRRGRGQGASFDADREVFTTLSMDPQTKANGQPITPVQFTIRTQEHADTCLHLFEKIVTMSGYSPQTFGVNIQGQAESGTALRIREGKTLKTRGRKARYWVPAIEQVLETMLAIDREVLGHTDHGVFRPSVDEAEVIVNNPVEVAQTVSMLRQARAASVETAVRMAQPDLDDEAVVAEVARIQDEDTLTTEPTGGLP